MLLGNGQMVFSQKRRLVIGEAKIIHPGDQPIHIGAEPPKVPHRVLTQDRTQRILVAVVGEHPVLHRPIHGDPGILINLTGIAAVQAPAGFHRIPAGTVGKPVQECSNHLLLQGVIRRKLGIADSLNDSLVYAPFHRILIVAAFRHILKLNGSKPRRLSGKPVQEGHKHCPRERPLRAKGCGRNTLYDLVVITVVDGVTVVGIAAVRHIRKAVSLCRERQAAQQKNQRHTE